MDFAIFMGDERTMIYKRGQGIVLNEPSVVFTAGKKVLGVGKTAAKLATKQAMLGEVREIDILAKPIQCGRILDTHQAGVLFNELFKKVRGINPTIKSKCLICIPSTLTAEELNDYKTAIYVAGVAEAEFIPAVVASAIGLGYKMDEEFAVLSVIAESGLTEVTVIKNGEIVAGGRLEQNSKLKDAKKSVCGGAALTEYSGNRLSIINGAGQLLEKVELVKKIVKVN